MKRSYRRRPNAPAETSEQLLVFRDENREPTGKYSRRVGAALHPSKPCTQATARISERGLSLRTIMPVPNVNNHESPRILNHSAMNLFFVLSPHHRYPQRLSCRCDFHHRLIV